MREEQCQQQGLSESSYIYATDCPWEKKEETSPMLTKEGSGKEEIEKPQKSTAQAINSPLPEAPSPDLVYTLPAPQPTPKAPTKKASPSLPAMQNFKRLVATVQNFATTSKTMAGTHIAWHNGWFWCRFGFRAPEPRQSYKLFSSFNSHQRLKELVLGEHSLPHFLF